MADRFALEGYLIEELIGFGGTGEVWRGREVATGDTVALKRLRRRGPAATERLRREAAMLGAVAGPHVVGVRRLVVEDEEAVLVMDHAAGGSLATVLGVRGSLPAAEVVTVLAPIASALAAAHARDLVHGDLTPANILFAADGRPLLADFGVARALGVTGPVVEATVDYLDPAVAAGAAPGPASDVFALGAVGFAALAGRPLWGSGSADQIQARASIGVRPGLSELVPTAPEGLVTAIESALHLDPEERPDAGSFATAVLRSGAAAPVRLVTAVLPVPAPVTRRVRPAPVSRDAPPQHQTQSPSRSRSRATGRSSAPDRSDRSRPGSGWPRRLGLAGAGVAALIGAAGLGVGLGHRGGGQARPLAAAAPRAVGPAESPTASADQPADPAPTAANPRPASRPMGSLPPAPSSWFAVVAHLDAARAAAFAAGRPAGLAEVYAPGAAAYPADLAMLNSLASRGLRARGFTATVEQVHPTVATATGEAVRVVDRLSGYALVDATGRIVGRGSPRPSRAYTMWLSRVDETWRVRSVGPLDPH